MGVLKFGQFCAHLSIFLLFVCFYKMNNKVYYVWLMEKICLGTITYIQPFRHCIAPFSLICFYVIHLTLCRPELAKGYFDS